MRIQLTVEYPKKDIEVEPWFSSFDYKTRTSETCTPMTQLEVRINEEGQCAACIKETFPPVRHRGDTKQATPADVVKVLADAINMLPPHQRLQVLSSIDTSPGSP